MVLNETCIMVFIGNKKLYCVFLNLFYLDSQYFKTAVIPYGDNWPLSKSPATNPSAIHSALEDYSLLTIHTSPSWLEACPRIRYEVRLTNHWQQYKDIHSVMCTPLMVIKIITVAGTTVPIQLKAIQHKQYYWTCIQISVLKIWAHGPVLQSICNGSEF